MTATHPKTEYPNHRLILLLPGSNRLLAEKHHESIRLPSVGRWVEPWPPHLTKYIEKRWGLKTIILDFLQGLPLREPCVFTEIRTPEANLKVEGLQSVTLDSVSDTELSQEERRVVSQMLAGDSRDRGPFSRVGWIDETFAWIRAETALHDLEFTDDIRQYNYQHSANGHYALARFATQAGNAYWLKATARHHAVELDITVHLARQYPKYLPRLLAARKDWNAWVTEEFGTPLLTSMSLETVEGAIRTFAELQKETIGKSASLLGSGCFDQRLCTLLDHVWEIIDYLEDVYRLENTTIYPPINRVRLHQLGHLLEDACHRMMACEVPDTLIWGDMYPGNILFDGTNYLFVDWAETYVGNPFLSFRLDAMKLLQDDYHKWIDQLTLTYKKCWHEHVSEAIIEKAFGLVPFLGLLSWLYRRGTWLTFPRRNDHSFHNHCRKVAHQINESAAEAQLHRLLYR
jgi:hypothetical protein